MFIQLPLYSMRDRQKPKEAESAPLCRLRLTEPSAPWNSLQTPWTLVFRKLAVLPRKLGRSKRNLTGLQTISAIWLENIMTLAWRTCCRLRRHHLFGRPYATHSQ